jgi:hypothetical protein
LKEVKTSGEIASCRPGTAASAEQPRFVGSRLDYFSLVVSAAAFSPGLFSSALPSPVGSISR